MVEEGSGWRGLRDEAQGGVQMRWVRGSGPRDLGQPGGVQCSGREFRMGGDGVCKSVDDQVDVPRNSYSTVKQLSSNWWKEIRKNIQKE